MPKDQDRGPRRLAIVAATVGVAAALLVAVRVALPELIPRRSEDQMAREVDRALDDVFRAEGVDRESLSGRDGEGEQPAELRAQVPSTSSLASMNAEISRAVTDHGAQVLDALERGPQPERPSALTLELGTEETVTHRVTLSPEASRKADEETDGAPRLAIVFDDLGWSMQGLAAELLDFPAPLTFAVLPGLVHSRPFAEAARERGHEIILHLPMEPVDTERHDPGPGAILVGLSDEENRRRLQRQLDGLPFYVGVSNHMGSRVTADEPLVDLVLRGIRQSKRDLFILDSRTTPYSVVSARARRAGVPCITSNLFLDGGDEGEKLAAVRADRVAGIAERKGQAVAIGHVRPETLAAVRDAIPGWRARGIRLVALSDLLHR
jgi:polysaccharide deacetylase 2 family uncharacterized protein YibQ